jgi:hypothetical protein
MGKKLHDALLVALQSLSLVFNMVLHFNLPLVKQINLLPNFNQGKLTGGEKTASVPLSVVRLSVVSVPTVK